MGVLASFLAPSSLLSFRSRLLASFVSFTCSRNLALQSAVPLAVSALIGNILVHSIPILVFRALTRENWFDMVLGILVEAQLGNFCGIKIP